MNFTGKKGIDMTNPELFELLDRFERSSLQTLKRSEERRVGKECRL